MEFVALSTPLILCSLEFSVKPILTIPNCFIIELNRFSFNFILFAHYCFVWMQWLLPICLLKFQLYHNIYLSERLPLIHQLVVKVGRYIFIKFSSFFYIFFFHAISPFNTVSVRTIEYSFTFFHKVSTR